MLLSSSAASAEDALPGDGRASTPEQRRDVGVVPRYGIDFEDNQLRWSYDWRAPYDTNQVSSGVRFPYPEVSPVVPSDLVVVENDAYHQQGESRTAEGERAETNPANGDWNLTTTDIKVPGYGRVFRWDMVCPNAQGHAGHRGHESQESHQGHDGTYTGATTVDVKERRMVFSYQWGDRAFDDGFVFFHYLPYSLSNDHGGKHT